ncbi:MAG: HAMP domain-containing protein [Alphaproteobacteria bacterium]|nr:HAMP domain-containing protein [Alphaproteobacteria bacterium]
MRNLLPDTIAFRAMALLVVGLAFTHFISNLFYTNDRESALLAAGGEHSIQWVATMGMVSDTVSGKDWDKVIERANSDDRVVSMTAAPWVTSHTGSGWREMALQRELARHVTPVQLEKYRISYVPANRIGRDYATVHTELTPGNSGRLMEMSDGMILISMLLDTGDWLNMAAAVQPPPPLFSARLGLSMAVMLVAVVAISALIVGRMTEPLKQLSRAAEKLGMDVQAPAIPEIGPEEVRRTARAFNVMQNRIRRFVEDRTQMLGAIAHDLGTPITRLRLRAEFVEDKAVRAKVLRDLDDMQQMVASTLSFIREESASEPQSTVDISSLMSRVCDDFADQGLDVTLEDVPRWILVDCRPVALRRALGNLVDNAVKYGQSAQVSLVQEDSALKIMIEDQGPGIADDRQEDVFKPFLRLEDSRNRETGGTGLGMSVARTIIRAHGGDIRLNNRAEGGLSIEVRLPLSRQTSAASQVVQQHSSETKTASVIEAAKKEIQSRGIACKSVERTKEWKTL